MKLNHSSFTFALAVSDIGNAIPFGLSSGIKTSTVNRSEWILSALFAVAAILLILRLLGWKSRLSTWATLFSAACWAAATSYVVWIPHATIRARLGIGLIFAGLTIVSFFAHASEKLSENVGVG